MIPGWVRWGSLALALVALGTSIYLAIGHATLTQLACPNTGTIDCAKVTSSTYSKVAGVPVAYAGVLWSVLMAALCLPRAWAWPAMHRVRLEVGVVGFVGVLYLIWAEIMLGALCLWCTLVHGTVIGLGVLAVAGWVLDTPRTSTSSHREVAQEKA